MPSIDDPEALRALIPHLRAFARTLEPDPERADGLVRDALVETLRNWPVGAPADEMRTRIEAAVEGRGGSAGPRGED